MARIEEDGRLAIDSAWLASRASKLAAFGEAGEDSYKIAYPGHNMLGPNDEVAFFNRSLNIDENGKLVSLPIYLSKKLTEQFLNGIEESGKQDATLAIKLNPKLKLIPLEEARYIWKVLNNPEPITEPEPIAQESIAEAA